MISLWKLSAGILRPAVDAWNVYIKGNLEVDGTIQLDGGVTLDGSVIIEETATEALLVRKEADGGDLIAFNTTSNIILHTGDHNAANAAGPAILNEAATTTNPTLVPNKADIDTGLGWSTNALEFIVNSSRPVRIDATDLIIFGGAVKCSGTVVAGTTPTTAGHPVMLNEVASAINPVFALADDNDTGLGSSGADQLSLIAGATETLRCETTVLTPKVPLAVGTIDITADSGDIVLIDMSVTDVPAAATSESIAIAIDATPIITAKALADSSGGIYEHEVVMGGYVRRKSTVGITASVTQIIGNGPLTSDVNQISVCANPNDTVTLPVDQIGREVYVYNDGAQTLQVFPASGDDLGGGAGISTTIVAGSWKRFQCYKAGFWKDVS